MYPLFLPQALHAALPALTNSFIAIFKVVSLVTVVSLYELTGALSLALAGDAEWRSFHLEGYLFIGLFQLGLSLLFLLTLRLWDTQPAIAPGAASAAATVTAAGSDHPPAKTPRRRKQACCEGESSA